MKANDDEFKLEVPLDASQVEDRDPKQEVKVAVRGRDGKILEQVVRLNKEGGGTAVFTFARNPGQLQLAVGPGNASGEELYALQTITRDLSIRLWQRNTLLLPPLLIPPYYWHWWRRWCREFTITGRVVCPDGSPVPGAEVCAYDVDMWWWWCSQQTVGCATTDATGAFEIKFRWCCGWWPWWWWKQRIWSLEPSLADHIMPLLQDTLKLRKPPIPQPQPDPAIFEAMLAAPGSEMRQSRPKMTSVAAPIVPTDLEGIRHRLAERLPRVPELERLHLWPWWPWYPWWDCTPDLIFRVKQNCHGSSATFIVDENCWNARWNIPTNLNVTLVANEEACCICDNCPPPPGNCLVISEACSYQLDSIGGNPGAVAAPAGYQNSGVVNTWGDRPFAGNVPISGIFGDTADVDYYEFEWAINPAGPWNDMPPLAAGGFGRSFWGPGLPAGPVDFHPVSFPLINLGGRNVFETREHFEANNDPFNWGLTRFWTGNRDMLMNWLTENTFPDGTYYLRVKGWDRLGDTLVEPRILPLCDTEMDNYLVLTIDNRLEGPLSGHPTAPNHPCGTGTVHICTTEPDTDFVSVRINGVEAEACTVVNAKDGGTLEIDFLAHDTDAHLAYYTLKATYGENLEVDLLNLPSAVLSNPFGGQQGPTYGDALGQGAVSPHWEGGTFRLTIKKLQEAFPQTCCYQLELWAYKRTIVSCHGGAAHWNRSEYSLTVVV